MFERLKGFVAALPAIQSVIPKVKAGMRSLPGYAKVGSTSALRKPELNLANQDLAATYRTGATTQEVIRNLSRVSPDLSAATSAYIRVGLPEKYMAVARNPDGTVNREATQLAAGILARFDLMPDYTTGFATTSTVRSISEALAKEMLHEGAASIEVVLDKQRLPMRFQPVPVSTLTFYQDKDGLKPVQKVGGVELQLDIPTFIYTSLDQSLLTAYAQSPLEAAVQPVIASMGFLNDLRRVCQRHVYPRYNIEIDEAKLRARIPPEILNDPAKLPDYLNQIISEVETAISGLGVEDALVHYDFIKVTFIEGGSGDVPNTFDTVKGIYDEKVATGAKVLPAILGHGSGSQNVASTETMLFMLSANGTVRIKIQELLSKALTLSVRLFGMDVTVEFKFDSIDLRPEKELEAFRSMEFSRITDLLSLGFISDDDACLILTGRLTPDGYTPKSGTMFKQLSARAAENPYSGSSTGPGGGAMNQSLKPTTPTKPKS